MRSRGRGVAGGGAGPAGTPRLAPLGALGPSEKRGADALRHVLWIGGPPGAGKTAVASRIARRNGLRCYNADTRTWEHRDRALAAANAAARRWEAMPPEERWMQPAPAEMFEMSLHVERGPMVLDDLRGLPTSPLVVAEGSCLPAFAVSSGVADRSMVVWLIPTRRFQEKMLEARGTAPSVTALYMLLRCRIAEEAMEHGVRILTVDGSRDVAGTVAEIEKLFAEALAEGPRATTAAERRGLLREANEAIAGQVRAYYARPWAEGEAESVVREFLCECGDTSCEEIVRIQVRELSSAEVLAPGHWGV